MKFLKYYSLLILVVFSCNEFEDLNVNPNEPTTVSPGVLFTSAIRTSVQTTSNEAFLLSNNIAQLTAKTLRAEVDFYGWNAFPTVWEGLYESLTDLKSLTAIATAENNNKMIGAAMVFEVWIFPSLPMPTGIFPTVRQ